MSEDDISIRKRKLDFRVRVRHPYKKVAIFADTLDLTVAPLHVKVDFDHLGKKLCNVSHLNLNPDLPLSLTRDTPSNGNGISLGRGAVSELRSTSLNIGSELGRGGAAGCGLQHRRWLQRLELGRSRGRPDHRS